MRYNAKLVSDNYNNNILGIAKVEDLIEGAVLYKAQICHVCVRVLHCAKKQTGEISPYTVNSLFFTKR